MPLRTLPEGRRRLTKAMTHAEFRLWLRLREASPRFRRQVPVGPYIVDFLCAAARVIVEVDGGQHFHDTGRALDEERTRWLDEQGYRVLRVTNVDVRENIEGVFEAILKAVEERTGRVPPPETG